MIKKLLNLFKSKKVTPTEVIARTYIDSLKQNNCYAETSQHIIQRNWLLEKTKGDNRIYELEQMILSNKRVRTKYYKELISLYIKYRFKPSKKVEFRENKHNNMHIRDITPVIEEEVSTQSLLPNKEDSIYITQGKFTKEGIGYYD